MLEITTGYDTMKIVAFFSIMVLHFGRFRDRHNLLNILIRLRDWRDFYRIRQIRVKETAWWREIIDFDENGCRSLFMTVVSDAELLRSDMSNEDEVAGFHERHQQAKDLVIWVESEVEKLFSEAITILPSGQVDLIEDQLMKDVDDMRAEVESVSGFCWRRVPSQADPDRVKKLVKLEMHILGLQEDYYEWVENSEFIRCHPDCSEELQSEAEQTFVQRLDAKQWRRFTSRRKMELSRAINRHDFWSNFTLDCENDLDARRKYGKSKSTTNKKTTKKNIKTGLRSTEMAHHDLLEAGRRLYEAQRAEVLYQEWTLQSQGDNNASSLLDENQSSNVSDVGTQAESDQIERRKRKAEHMPLDEPPPKRLATVDLRDQPHQDCPFQATASLPKPNDSFKDKPSRSRCQADPTTIKSQASIFRSYDESLLKRLVAVKARSLRARVAGRLATSISIPTSRAAELPIHMLNTSQKSGTTLHLDPGPMISPAEGNKFHQQETGNPLSRKRNLDKVDDSMIEERCKHMRPNDCLERPPISPHPPTPPGCESHESQSPAITSASEDASNIHFVDGSDIQIQGLEAEATKKRTSGNEERHTDDVTSKRKRLDDDSLYPSKIPRLSVQKPRRSTRLSVKTMKNLTVSSKLWHQNQKTRNVHMVQ